MNNIMVITNCSSAQISSQNLYAEKLFGKRDQTVQWTFYTTGKTCRHTSKDPGTA